MTDAPREGQPQEGMPDTRHALIAFLAVVVLTFCVYLPTLNNELLEWDDAGYIVKNHFIQELNFETVRWAFTTFYTNYWAPLTWLSFAVDHAVWGLNPVGYHLTNTILHAMNAGMAFLLFIHLLKIPGTAQNAAPAQASFLKEKNALIGTAFLAALFYALHPLRVESVAWAADRKDVLAVFFGLPAFLAYVRHASSITSNNARPRPLLSNSPYLWLTAAFYLLSLLSKPLLVTAPFALLVLDWFPLRRFAGERTADILLEKAPLFAFAGIISLITTTANKPLFVSLEEFDLFTRLLNAAKSLVAYLQLTVWPADLSPFYLRPANITEIGFEYGLPLLILAAITLLCVLTARRLPLFIAVWSIYVITIFPLLGLTQAGPQAMAARYTYLAGLPLSLLAASGIAACYAKCPFSRPARWSVIGVSVIMIFLYCLLTWQHIAFWKNDVTLWTRVIDLTPHSIGRAYFQRSLGYLAGGDHERALADMDEALLIAGRKGYSRMHDIYLARARIRTRMGDYHGAISDYSSALAADRSDQRTVYYAERGRLYQEVGRLDLAEQDLAMAGPSGDQ